jgi:hypothetical protein
MCISVDDIGCKTGMRAWTHGARVAQYSDEATVRATPSSSKRLFLSSSKHHVIQLNDVVSFTGLKSKNT